MAKLHKPVSAIDLFTHRDFSHIKRWNSHLPQKVDACVHDLVLQHAKDAPQSSAICSWDGDLTYQQLDSLSFRLAKHLVSSGVKRETLVPVCFKKSMYAVVAMLAILRVGGAFVPLDPSHPRVRLKSIIEKANAEIVVASPDTADLFYGTVKNIVEVCPSMLESTDSSLDHSLPQVSGDLAAFVLFTSGSTGKPKGIIQEHASVSTGSLAHGRFLGVTSKSRVFQYAAFTFDVSMMDVFTTLIHGGCVCIPSEEDRMSSFTSVMNKMKVNWVLFTPSVASLISPDEVPTLQTLVFGGEAVKQENINRWFGKVRLFNCYGPAECGACAMSEITHASSRPGNIGRQFGAELCWVVNPENHNLVQPIGAVGELVVEGPTLARGYLDDLAKTQAVFIKDLKWPGGLGPNRPRRLYKTGDLVRQNSDGTLDFAGRKDFQLKVRGQRVELGEVEYQLAAFPAIALSIAAMPQSGPYAHTLVGVLQLHQEKAIRTKALTIELVPNEDMMRLKFDKGNLVRFLKSKLPNYMIPSHLFIVSSLPLSVSGKIDRKLVEAWLATLTRVIEARTTSERPERELLSNKNALELCSKTLSLISPPGSELYESMKGTNFHLAAVGLDSIQTISLTMFIRQQWGVKIHLDILMDPASTVWTVSNEIEKLVAGGSNSTTGPNVNFIKTFEKYTRDALKQCARPELELKNVFLTGATGFLGARIIQQLYHRLDIRKVAVLVRSESLESAIQRLTNMAKLFGWWTDRCFEKLEIWVGDLAKPKLGLGHAHWRQLCGQGSPTERITTIIHNGAAVNWNATFSSLKASNVDATVDLLEAASHSAALLEFVYVSGGQQLKIGNDEDMVIAEEVAKTNGYAQTKFLAEFVVKEYAQRFAPAQQHVSIVKPGFIIGSIEDGMGVSDDFIWRLTASCIDIRGYNGSESDSWIFVSDVDHVATVVVNCCRSKWTKDQCRQADVIKILDGIPVSVFWCILRDSGYELSPLASGTWLDRVYAAIETRREEHPLFPLLQTVEEGQGTLGSPCNPQKALEINEERVKTAVKKNIEYLQHIGFLPNTTGSGRRAVWDEKSKHACQITVSQVAVA